MEPSKNSLLKLLKDRREEIFLNLGLIALFSVGLVFGIRALSGLTLFTFVDEVEKFVAAKMINDGMHLYKDIFAHHGLLPYLLVHLYTKVVSPTNFSFARVINLIFALFSALAIFTSPILDTFSKKVWGVAFFIAGLSPVWLIQGLHFVLHHSLGGLLFVIPVMHLVLPAMFLGEVSKRGVFISGAFIVLMCFTSYPLGVPAILLTLSALLSIRVSAQMRKQIFLYFLLGVLITTGLLLLWLWVFGDLVGYYVYHFYFNQTVYKDIIRFDLTHVFKNFRLWTSPKKLVHLTSFVQMVIWFLLSSPLLLIKRNNHKVAKLGSLFLLLFGVLMLNSRGNQGIDNAGFVIANIAILSAVIVALFGGMKDKRYQWLIVLLFIITVTTIEFIGGVSKSAPHEVMRKDFDQYHFAHEPSMEEPYELIRRFVEKDEKIQVLVFDPVVYIKANRLPASGNIYYLPWQATYNRQPLLNYRIDLCADILDSQPKIIWFDHWVVYGRYSIDDYEPCFTEILKRDYLKLKDDENIYVQTRFAEEAGFTDLLP
ncbi:MAG: hypothetical protein ACOX7C_08340 [Brevefilum sp.]